MNDRIGERLAELRRAHSMSQDELAEMLHVSRQAISKWERDLSLPDIRSLAHLADIYGITVDDILHEETSTRKEREGTRADASESDAPAPRQPAEAAASSPSAEEIVAALKTQTNRTNRRRFKFAIIICAASLLILFWFIILANRPLLYVWTVRGTIESSGSGYLVLDVDQNDQTRVQEEADELVFELTSDTIYVVDQSPSEDIDGSTLEPGMNVEVYYDSKQPDRSDVANAPIAASSVTILTDMVSGNESPATPQSGSNE